MAAVQLGACWLLVLVSTLLASSVGATRISQSDKLAGAATQARTSQRWHSQQRVGGGHQLRADEDGLQGSKGAGATVSAQKKPHTLSEETPWQVRCSLTVGEWCKDFHLQKPVEWKPPPRGNKTCPGDCNGVGVCNADSGLCMCPGGWMGPDCATRQLRPCTNSLSDCNRGWGANATSHIDENGRDRDPYAPGRGTMLRCSGICDPELGTCWCDGPKGYIPPPPGSPPGTPPVRRTRQLMYPEFQLKTDKEGNSLGFGGTMTWEDLYGPEGWCVADKPKMSKTIPCILDGLQGTFCDQVVENYCINQCSGRGICSLGYCYCDKGWYGTDCSLASSSVDLQSAPPSRIATSPWLKDVVEEPVAAKDPPPAPTRPRPLIYIYDLEPLYNTKLLQYRMAGTWCTHRKFQEHNRTEEVSNWCYSAEQLFHESLTQSPHRTYDPEEADFFYVPWYGACIVYPVQGQADLPRFAAFEGPRVSHASMSALQLVQWLNSTSPYWSRRGGRDHIWLFVHDEGACWAPTAIKDSIWLTHWGRMDEDHKSNTAFESDNYNTDMVCKSQPEGWVKFTRGHPCYDPAKDLVVPAHRTSTHYSDSPLMGKPPKHRDLLLFFRGDTGAHRQPQYSRGIRQKIDRLAREKKWREQYNIVIGGRDVPGEYSELLSRSKFCLVAPGDGWSPRLEDSVLHGCVPLIIKDNVHDVFESLFDYPKFSVRVKEADVARIPEILMAITPAQLTSMQQHLGRVWHRFRWASAKYQVETQRRLDHAIEAYDAARRARRAAQASGSHERTGTRQLLSEATNTTRMFPRPFRGDIRVDDAFATIIQWLYTRIPQTR